MAQSAGLHEDATLLGPDTVDRHRAIVSIQEELEAVDWYDQRVAAAADPELKALLAHNRDEEKEHAAMVIEWLRRRDPVFDRQLRTYLFTETPLLQVEAGAMGGSGDGGPAGGGPGGGGLAGGGPGGGEAAVAGLAGDGSLGVGSPRGQLR